MSIFKTIKERWCAKSPIFFQNLKKIMISVGTSATAIWMANESMNLELHPYILDTCKYIIAISVASGLTAQLTRDTTSNT
jgi:hypothetical protein